VVGLERITGEICDFTLRLYC